MSKDKIYRIIEIIVTAILAVAGTLLVEACTVSMALSKNNRHSDIKTDQIQSTRVDSTNVSLEYE